MFLIYGIKLYSFPKHQLKFEHDFQGKGEFTMEYKEHLPVSNDVQMQLVSNYKGSKPVE